MVKNWWKSVLVDININMSNTTQFSEPVTVRCAQAEVIDKIATVSSITVTRILNRIVEKALLAFVAELGHYVIVVEGADYDNNSNPSVETVTDLIRSQVESGLVKIVKNEKKNKNRKNRRKNKNKKK